MKTIAQPAVITPAIIGLALLFAVVTFIGVTGRRLPLLSNVRVDIILLVIIGMTMCTQGRDRTRRRDGTVDSPTGDPRLPPRRTHPAHHAGCLRRLEASLYPECIEEIEAVENAARSLGHQCVVMAVREEIFPIIHWLKEYQPDVVFNLCESVYGNSCWEMNIPALLDLFRIPYTGSSPLTLGLCQDKGKVKDILQSQGILTPRYKIFEQAVGPVKGNIFPIIVKPLHEDGSLGISRESVVFDDETLRRQIQYVIEQYQQPALVEEFIDGRELNVGLMETNGKVVVLPISEIDYSEFPQEVPKICGYEAKWVTESPEYQKSKPVCPAPLEGVMKKRVDHIAIKVFKLFECRDYARVDIRIDRDGKIYVLEVNPNPDISPQSGMTRALRVQGMDYTEIVGRLLERAFQRRGEEIRK